MMLDGLMNQLTHNWRIEFWSSTDLSFGSFEWLAPKATCFDTLKPSGSKAWLWFAGKFSSYR